MKMMTYYNAMRRAENLINQLEDRLPPIGNKRIWDRLMHVIRQQHKFSAKVVHLIQKADQSQNMTRGEEE